MQQCGWTRTKVSAWGAGDEGVALRSGRITDLNICTPAITLGGVGRYVVRARTGRSGVSIL